MYYVLAFLAGMAMGAIVLDWAQTKLASKRKRRKTRRPVSNAQRHRNNGWASRLGQAGAHMDMMRKEAKAFRQAAAEARRPGVTADDIDEMLPGTRDDYTMPF